MIRIAVIGAGSVVFERSLLTDMLSLEELHGCAIALHDIDPDRLETATLMAHRVAEQLGAAPSITAHADRRAALDGADFVINMVQIGMHAATLLDFEIPRRYGLKQTIADTAGIGGIFRGLRAIPFMQAMVREMRAVCPDALLLNYTNPMSSLTWSVYDAFPEQRVVGLCHNVQYTALALAEYLGVAPERLSYDCDGINHMTWFLRLEVDGKDAYPRCAAPPRTRKYSPATACASSCCASSAGSSANRASTPPNTRPISCAATTRSPPTTCRLTNTSAAARRTCATTPRHAARCWRASH
jgi:alpha-galactosidase